MAAAKCIGGLGLVAEGRGDVDLAFQLMREREARMRDLGDEFQAEVSLDLLSGIYVRSGRLAEARQHLQAHPTLRRTPYAMMAHVKAGEHAEAMRNLPNVTATMLAQGRFCDVDICLHAWAILLLSDCDLVKEPCSSAEPIAVTRSERIARAVAILSLLRADIRYCFQDRIGVGQLLAELQGEALEPGAMSQEQLDQALEELAREMLTIRLVQG
jgi:hypothetical protein